MSLSYQQTSQLAYAKLSATATETAWSQAYNAGNLFACISLTRTVPGEDTSSLQMLGKNILNHFESEFFTIEEKNVTTIREAINKSVEKLPPEVSITFCLAYFKEATVFLFLLGGGRVILKRGEKLGVLLEQHDTSPPSLHTASGYVQNGDILLLATHHFTKHLSDKHIRDALLLSLPNDIAEELSVSMHQRADGAQAAIVVSYQGVSQHKQEAAPDLQEDQETESQERYQPDEAPSLHHQKPRLTLPRFSLPARLNLSLKKLHLSHTKKLLLSIIVIIVVLLVLSISFTKQRQEATQTKEQFNAIYTPALKQYDEGKALAELNPTMSEADLRKAESLLLAGKDTFPADSNEAKQINELLKKVQKELAGQPQDTTNSKKVSVEKTSLLAIAQATPEGRAFAQNNTSVYVVTDTAVVQVSKKDGNKKSIIENKKAWEKPTGIALFGGNIYILDQTNGVLKYVATGNSFSKSSYFAEKPDLSKAVSMAIDSSLYILFSDGTVKKYLRGKEEAFAIKGLTAPLSQPAKILTDEDTQNLYILDPKNSRVVKFTKNGTFQAQYTAGVIKQAKEFEILEKDKKLRVLSQDAIWEITVDK